MTEDEWKQLEVKLRPRLTEEFLDTLVEAAKVDGWTGDFIETQQFVQRMFAIAGKEAPEMTAYDENLE